MDRIPLIEVYYDNDKRNWDQLIDAEVTRRVLSGKVYQAIAYPSTGVLRVQKKLFRQKI